MRCIMRARAAARRCVQAACAARGRVWPQADARLRASSAPFARFAGPPSGAEAEAVCTTPPFTPAYSRTDVHSGEIRTVPRSETPRGEGGLVVKHSRQVPTHAIPAESTNAVTAVQARVTGLLSWIRIQLYGFAEEVRVCSDGH